MPTRRTLLFTAVCSVIMPCGLVVAPTVAADPEAMAFVTKIYDAYKGENSQGILLSDDAEIRRYFEPSMAVLIIKDRKEARGEVPTLDFDPFVNAQDFEISEVDIAVRDVPPDKAVATVRFKNIDRSERVVLDLVKIKTNWRIADITWGASGKTTKLRDLYRH
jgi:hypothetical protein